MHSNKCLQTMLVLLMYTLVSPLLRELAAQTAPQAPTEQVLGAETVGQVVHCRGSIHIFRDSSTIIQPLPGTTIENFDSLRSNVGSMSIELRPETGLDAEIRIGQETSLDFEIPPSIENVFANGQEWRGSIIHLHAGSLSINLQSIDRSAQLHIRVADLLLSAENANFSLQSTALGTVRISASEGMVRIISSTGQVLFANAQESVEYSNNTLQNIGTQGNRTGSANLSDALPQAAREYLLQSDRFLALYARLFAQEFSTVQKWISEDRIGLVGSEGEVESEKASLIAIIQEIRPLSLSLSRIIIQLEQLMQRNFPSGYSIQPDLSYRDFTRQFGEDLPSLSRRIRELNYIFKLYSIRNNGVID